MRPPARFQIAISLGFVYSAESWFGDSHEEAWDILSHPTLGLIARSQRNRIKFLPFKRASNWYEVRPRVSKGLKAAVPSLGGRVCVS
jgi:hypothetical protein